MPPAATGLDDLAWGPLRAADGPTIGVIGRDVPLELLDAVGARPHRLRGAPSLDTTEADVFLGTGIDRTARTALAHLLDSSFAGLDGIVACTDCEASVRLFYLLRELSRVDAERHVPPLHLVDVLHLDRPSSLRYTIGQLTELASTLERWTGNRITDGELATAVEARNELRRRLSALGARRHDRPALVSGTVALTACAAAGRANAADLLDLLPPDVEPGSGPGATRILLTGSAQDEPGVTAALEAAGLAVVAEDHGGGTLGLDLLTAAPTLEALARRYVADGRTPQSAANAVRGAHTAALASRAGADLVVAYVRVHDEAPLWDVAAQRATCDVPVVLVRDQHHGEIDLDALEQPR